jgi:hypothetical protein
MAPHRAGTDPQHPHSLAYVRVVTCSGSQLTRSFSHEFQPILRVLAAGVMIDW